MDIAPAVGVGGCTAWGCSMEDTKDGLNSTRRMPPPHEGRQDDKTEVGAEADRCRGKTRNRLSRCNSQTAVPGERRSPGQMPRYEDTENDQDASPKKEFNELFHFVEIWFCFHAGYQPPLFWRCPLH